MSFFFYFGSYEKRGTAKPFLLNRRLYRRQLLLITVNGHHHHTSKICSAESTNNKQSVHKNLLSCRQSCKCSCIKNIISFCIFIILRFDQKASVELCSSNKRTVILTRGAQKNATQVSKLALHFGNMSLHRKQKRLAERGGLRERFGKNLAKNEGI